jgi:hypothetical protein
MAERLRPKNFTPKSELISSKFVFSYFVELNAHLLSRCACVAGMVGKNVNMIETKADSL